MHAYVRRRPGFARDVSGAGLGEYALLAALIAGISAIAVTSLGIETRGTFTQIADATQEAGSGSSGGGGSGSGSTPGGSTGGGSGDNGSGDSGGSGDGGGTSPAPGVPGDNFAITLGSQALPQANRLSPWFFDFSSLIAFQDPGTVELSNLSWSGGSPSLPSWMSLDESTGIASGTPDLAGEVTFEVVASYLNAEGRQVFTLNVGGALIDVIQISAGDRHTCVVTTTGAAMCWGWNGHGQIGDGGGTNMERNRPVFVSGLNSGVLSITAGAEHSCAVTTSGAAMCWGRNNTGQIGDGTTVTRSTPVTVVTLESGVTSISALRDHTCVVTITGAARCWGWNSNGQLGDGTTTERREPVTVSGLGSGVASISAGGSHTCAVTSAGAAMCWGAGASGRLGDGTATQRLTPVTVSGLGSGVASISAGGNHTCALTTSGQARCWGWNSYGEVGDNSVVQRNAPVIVSGLDGGVASVVTGWTHSCAITTAGAARCWGDNTNGKLGDGTTTHRRIPVAVSGLGGDVASITGGWSHTCALAVSGAARCWGFNGDARLGEFGPSSSTPRLVVF